MPKRPDPDQMFRRAATVLVSGRDGPSTLDREAMTLDFVVSTETPVPMWDWARGEIVPEVLLAKGARLPDQVPLLDTHDRWSTSNVLGSVRNLRKSGGEVTGRAHFSKADKAAEAFEKYAEGHLRDFSAGYSYNPKDVRHVPKGETAEIGGQTWRGPVNVVVGWTLHEASACPIGADPNAKARAETFSPSPKETTEMETTTTETTDPVAAARELAERERKQKHEAELLRVRGINGICDQFDLGEAQRTKCVADGLTVDQVREIALAIVSDRLKEKPAAATDLGFRGSISFGADERDKFRACAVAALFQRAGRAELADPKMLGGHDLAGVTLRELTARSQRMANIDGPFWSQRTIASSDLPYILGDFQNKLVAEGYQTTSVTFRQWCKITTVGNAQTIHIPLPSQVGKAKKINLNDGEYTYLAVSDAQETTELQKPGGMIQITEKAILNDDLMQIQAWATGLGESIIHAVNAMVYGDGSSEYPGVLFGSGGVGETMRDSTALFTSGHANYIAHGSGGVPSVTTLAVGKAALRKQLDIGGTRPLNWAPRYVIAPAALEATVERELNSELLLGTSSGERNPFYKALEPVIEPLLDTISADAAAQWYLAAEKGKTVWVIFHESTNDAPLLEQRQEWTNDSLTFKGHVKVAVKAADWKGLFCNHGN